MSFVLSWSGYFSRKGWDPVLWAEACNIKSYEQCHKRISKMCIRPPTREEYLEKFCLSKLADSAAEDYLSSNVDKQPPNIETFVKQVRPEPQIPVVSPEHPKPVVTKEKTKRPARKNTKKQIQKTPVPEVGSGTDSIIDSVKKKKTSTKNKRPRKNAKSS
jgi:hypothetical protein